MPKIVYLEAQGNGTFRSNLRSDTLWGILCWTIRMLQDAKSAQVDDVGVLVKDYSKKEQDRKHAFYLSSAFPWIEDVNGKRTHFLPAPLTSNKPEKCIDPNKKEKEIPPNESKAQEMKRKAREEKKLEKQNKGYITWEQFACGFGNNKSTQEDASQIVASLSQPLASKGEIQPAATTSDAPTQEEFWKVAIDSQAVTHNQIDRRRLGTFTENEAGQLFHMNENFLDWPKIREQGIKVGKHGFYFFLEGDTTLVEPALRLMETMGIAGDKSIGKGHFKIDIVENAHDLDENHFSLPYISDDEANAHLCLSLYHPTENIRELSSYETAAAAGAPWRYKLEDRQGRNVYHNSSRQDGKLIFSEGSVFPKVQDAVAHPGKNWEAGKHRFGHTIYRYGHAFMLNMKIK